MGRSCITGRLRLARPLVAIYSGFVVAVWSLSASPQTGTGAISCEGAEPQLRAVDKALDQDRLAEAEHLLAPLQGSYPACSKLLLDRARLHAARNDPITAQELFSKAIDLAPQDAQPYYYFGQFSLSRQQYQQADYFSEQAVLRDPRYPDALALRGQILSMKGQTETARKLLEGACKLAPTNPQFHFQLGVLFDSRQLHPEAVQQFQKVLTLNPKDPRAYDYLALNLGSLGETKKAEAAYQMGLQVNEGPLFDSFLNYNYGRFLMKTNRLAESKVQLDRAVRLAPETRSVHYERGRLNLRLQKYQEAKTDAERALSLPDPSGFVLDLQVYYLLSTVYSRLGNIELAQKYAALCRDSRIPIQSQGRGDH